MNRYRTKYRQIWLGMAVIFILGILFGMQDSYPILLKPMKDERVWEVLASVKAEYAPVIRQSLQRDAKVMEIEDTYKGKDFCMHSVNYRVRTGRMDTGAFREALLWLAFIFGFYAYWCVIRYRWFCTEKRIPIFCLIYYIHQSDGKKRVCFAA